MTLQVLNVFMRIEIDALAIFLGAVMLINIRFKAGKLSREVHGITTLLVLVMAMLSLEALDWAFSLGQTMLFHNLRDIALLIYYLFNNITPFLWAYYVYYLVYRGKKRIRHRVLFLLPATVSLVLVLLNPIFHDLYRLDASNTYIRGSLFYLNVGLGYLYLLYSMLLPLLNRSRIDHKRFTSIIAFSLPPLAGSIVQFTLGGVDLLWTSSMVSILIIYLGVLKEKAGMDYLTGLYNRMQADMYLSGKIEKSSKEQTFSGMMIDIDRFKEINDRYGHHAGDEALEIAAKLLQKSLGKNDFLARFGGDEFLIVLETDNAEFLQQTASSIMRTFEHFNTTTDRPFQLNISLGCDVYDYELNMSRQQFIRHIDHLMYRKKRMRRQAGEYAAQ